MKRYFEPYTILVKKKALTIAWFICLLIFGQAGILISILIQGLNGAVVNWKLDNFYTFGIALLASGLYDFFKEYWREQIITFRSYKVVSLLLAIFAMMAMVAMVVKDQLTPQTGFNQLWLYMISIALALYIFSVNLLNDEYDEYQHLDDKRTRELGNKAESITNHDDRGVSM